MGEGATILSLPLDGEAGGRAWLNPKPITPLPPERDWEGEVLPPSLAYVAPGRNSRAGLQHHLDVWRAAWASEETGTGRRAEGPGEGIPARRAGGAETPPSPAGRVVGMVILSLVRTVSDLVDLQPTSTSSPSPRARSSRAAGQGDQPLETNVIKAIHVRDGQRVKKGDLLIEIDTSAGPIANG